ncbi:MAG: hypothetical protein C0408_01680, partial [Odoribacter sp.]|nr:hypothetical protein [Odoribacter sp.]
IHRLKSMNLILFLYIIFLSSISVRGCSQAPGNSLNNNSGNNNIPDTIIIKTTDILPLTDTGFVIQPGSRYQLNFDSLNFETEDDSDPGIYTFRGNNQRNSPVRGTLLNSPSKITGDWIFTTGTDTTNGLYGTWGGGAGWTGQPLYVEWSVEEQKELDGVFPQFKNGNSTLKEIIQVSLSGKIYFLDIESGKQTRNPLNVNNPIKGTPSIDGINKRYLLTGQGIQNRGSFGWRIFDLRKQSLLHLELMPSSFAFRMWGACDASPLIEPKTGTFIWPSESGIIFRGVLNNQKILAPEQYRYSFVEHTKQGIESSPAVYKFLGYFSDNAGNVFCVDLRKMQPRWHFFNTDDSDASPVIEVENETPYLYVGNEVDLQGPKGKAFLRKLNGLTGKLEWEYERICYNVTQPKTDNGGMLSTPLAGRKKAKGLIWTIFSRVDLYGRGSFVCLNKSDGTVKYEVPLGYYSWVSPIAVYDPDGNAFIYFSDVGGNIYLINGESGEIVFKQKMDSIFESSPIAIGNRIIQPARGNRIYCFMLQ